MKIDRITTIRQGYPTQGRLSVTEIVVTLLGRFRRLENAFIVAMPVDEAQAQVVGRASVRAALADAEKLGRRLTCQVASVDGASAVTEGRRDADWRRPAGLGRQRVLASAS